ncbi:Lrp/AsnC family transcriptional regulator [Candidatus Poseidoniales archaeon]|nr:Lrp/AsnC family transcriptional regulator [Candidatus Poseidoniales archaeon]MDB3879401.1 Lrp/AsnC family transcriptional regulator [bacterium]MDA8718375.1 Lrp/AsnC family transcriptional regulator [Candidatus Poseidoniales archaeon]MDB2348506.1 Lrp/AsnC family transcriptional regulator [Candidatus Poseidoniales archaeon]MDB2367615.1 Lrp/AsnC family transcriptional regulator [Candidatus Poseidoniales archaeon]
MQLDDTDRRLLAVLLEDARISQRGLAQRIGVAQGTITNRLRRLEELGVIKGYTVLLEPESIGWTMTVITGLRIEKGSMINVQQNIAADHRVFAVYDVTGDYDSMVLARVKSRKDLDDLTKTVFTLKGVQRSFTQVVLNTVKEDGRVIPPVV